MRRHSEGVDDPVALAGPRIPWSGSWTVERVIQTLEPFVNAERRTRLQEVFAARLASVTVVMDAPHDPHNGAAILRTCDAMGVPEVHVVRRDESLLVVRKVAKGTERWVDVTEHASPAEAVAALDASGFALAATHPDGTLQPEDLASIPKLALVLGNERDGIREELLNRARYTVRVPMRGFVESLNVSVAAGILLAAATRGRAGDLPTPTRDLLYARGLFHSLPRAQDILKAAAG